MNLELSGGGGERGQLASLMQGGWPPTQYVAKVLELWMPLLQLPDYI